MSKLQDRGKALEDKFFQEQEAKALLALQEQIKNQEIQKSIAEHTGISSESVIASIVNQGISIESFVAIRLIPLVLMSWASGSVEGAEREAIHNHMFEKGIKKDSPAHVMVDGWLSSKPDASLEASWVDFVQEYTKTLSDADKKSFVAEILGNADDVANAAGGFWGFGAVSEGEQALLDRLHGLLK